jgi:translation initiation factor IF-2
LAKKLRVYELAKHYGVDSPAIQKMMRDMHAEAKSHMSVVEADIVDKIHSAFQHKRELMRLQYAKAHNMDPEKLVHVASFRPLDKPEAPEEPEPVKKVAKKTTKKKAAKKKATTKKKVAKKTTKKKAATKKAVAKKTEAVEEKAEEKAAKTTKKAKTAKKPGFRARIVKKADIPEPVVEEDVVVEAKETVTTEPVEVEETTTDSTTETVEAEGAATEETPAEEETKTEEEDKSRTVKPRERRVAKIIRMGEGVVQTKNGVVQPQEAKRQPERRPEQSWNWNQVQRDSSGPRDASVGSNVKDSVRESVKAAVQRRQEAIGSQATTKRKRRKKKKVDEVAISQNIKQTLAQIDGTGGKRKHRKSDSEDTEDVSTDILRITEFITLQELAEKFEIQAREIITKLFGMGMMATMNQRLEKDTIELLAAEFEKEVEFLTELGEEELHVEEVAQEDIEQRPPVVTVMGHVDHGKTSLLDYIRHANVIAGEAGGITQHIGAYKVETNGGPVTFLDTPGHEAFSAMRARGAQVTDIVILIVAADDRLMPQTIEAINHAKAAGVPMIVAINKIDLPAARPDLVKQDLLSHSVVIEEFGGDVLCVEISAKKGTNVDKLMELIHLQSEVLELGASPKGMARGVVVEASKEPGRGVLFTVLIEQGTLNVGDCFLVGLQDGRVRALLNERGEKLAAIKPGEPAVILGANEVPVAGDRMHVMESDRDARDLAAKRRHMQRIQQFSAPKKTITLENLADMVATSDMKDLPIIVKGDVSGSVEAICDSLMQLNTDEVQVKVVHKGVGAINESDVLLASNTGAMIIGFHMRPGPAITEKAIAEHVTIEVFDIIYEVVDTMKKAMAGLLGSIQREVSTGSAEIRQVFRIPKVGTIAGAYVTNGTIIRNSLVRLVRDQVMIFEGRISSLKRFKEDTKEVASGYECGIGLENFHDLMDGDIVETYRIDEEVRTEL